MSKIGKLPVKLDGGVSVTVAGQLLTVSGPKGTLIFTVPQGVSVNVENEKAVVTLAKRDGPKDRFGLTRATLANMVKGVTTGVEKKLELTGVGYRAQASGQD